MLPDIPLIDLRGRATPHLVEACPAMVDDLLAAANGHYTRAGIAVADVISHAWLARNGTPYAFEIGEIARRLGRPGAHMLNLSFEWSCTSAATPDPAGEGMRLLRTLDWPLGSLGRNLVAAHMAGPAGEYLNITWPGFAGALTAIAPGRFAVAVNQPPVLRTGFGRIADWLAARCRVWQSNALPPAHLLRLALDRCATYAEAMALLADTPVALPVFYTLAGIEPGEGCVIERKPDDAHLRAGDVIAANHWIGFEHPGDRGRQSGERMCAMSTNKAIADPFGWLVPPILNPDTRVAFEANAATGRYRVQGYEADGEATTVLEGRLA
jgi:hypothetical protein